LQVFLNKNYPSSRFRSSLTLKLRSLYFAMSAKLGPYDIKYSVVVADLQRQGALKLEMEEYRVEAVW